MHDILFVTQADPRPMMTMIKVFKWQNVLHMEEAKSLSTQKLAINFTFLISLFCKFSSDVRSFSQVV